MSLVSKDSIIKACADAYKEGTGSDSVKVGQLSEKILEAISSGGSLPEGWATGEFNTTEETQSGNFSIEHGLGKIPNFIFIWSTATELINNQWRCTMKANLGEEYDEENGYYPAFGNTYGMRDTATAIATQNASADYDDRLVFWVPYYINRYYYPTTTFKWLAIRMEA